MLIDFNGKKRLWRGYPHFIGTKFNRLPFCIGPLGEEQTAFFLSQTAPASTGPDHVGDGQVVGGQSDRSCMVVKLWARR